MTVSWKAVVCGTLTDVNWREHLDGRARLDPYLVWADLTGFKGYMAAGPSQGFDVKNGLPLILELANADMPLDAIPSEADGIHPLCRSLNIQGAYFREYRTTAKFVTGSVSPSMVRELLRSPELVLRFQLGLPRLSPGASQPLQPAKGIKGMTVPVTVIGVIDDGFSLFHSRLQRASKSTRVHALWDQNRSIRQGESLQPSAGATRSCSVLGKQKLPQFGYGRFIAKDEIDRASNSIEESDGEDAAHDGLGYVPVLPDPTDGGLADAGNRPKRSMRRSSHGSGVLDLVTGCREGEAEPDAAGTAPLVLVQLPQPTVQDSSGGSLALHVLDALQFILDTAWGLVPYKSMGTNAVMATEQPDEGSDDKLLDRPYVENRVVVNLSYGTSAGPHDGSSMLEMAMDEMVANAGGKLQIVVAAGNLHGGNTHAALRMRQGHSGQLTWTVTPDNPMESFLELWFPGHDARGAALAEDFARHFLLRIEPPGGGPVQHLSCGQGFVLTHDPEQAEGVDKRNLSGGGQSLPVAGALFCRRVAQGLNGTMLLLAVAPTRRHLQGGEHERPVAPHGDWLLDLSWNEGTGPVDSGCEVVVHAWTERNDLLLRSYRAQQSKVYSHQPVGEYSEYTKETRELRQRNIQVGWPNNQAVTHGFYNLASTSNGRPALQGGRVWVVGGYRLSDGEMASYSSGGPARPSRVITELAKAPAASVSIDSYLGELKAHWANEEHPAHATWADVPGTDRRRPDIDAPSDQGSRTRGVLVGGMRAGQWARLSGTSAAAPQVARWLVNLQELLAESSSQPRATAVAEFFDKTLCPPETRSGDGNLARPTLRPDEDDLYRRGSLRLRPSAVQRVVTSAPAASEAAPARAEDVAPGSRPA